MSAYACETLIKSENAGCCCPGNHLSPFSSLTLSPQHFLFTFCLCTISVISHLLMFHHSICPSLYLQAPLGSPSLSLTLSTCRSASPSSCNTKSCSLASSSRLFILIMVAHLPRMHTCASLTRRHLVPENSDDL